MAGGETNILHGLPPLVAGLLLAASGWLGAAHRGNEALEFQPQLVVRPSNAQVVTTQGQPPTPDQNVPGRFLFQEAGFAVELRPKHWPSSKADVHEARGVTTVRAPFPRATLDVSIKGDKQAKPQLLELPKKSELKAADGKVRLEPGRHELLVKAEGYVPKRLTVNLKPGERKQVAMDLQALPSLPTLGLPVLPSGGVPSVSGGSLPAYPPPPSYRVPSYRPPAYQPPAPVPRFTPVAPVAPPPQPASHGPVPMFTPVP